MRLLPILTVMACLTGLAPAFGADAPPATPPLEPRIVGPFSIPDYPAKCQRRGIGGYVVVQFSLDVAGKPFNPVVVAADPRGAFDKTALRHVRRLRYAVPAQWLGQGSSRILELAYVFQVLEFPGSVQPKIRDFGNMDTIVISTRRKR